MLLPENAARGKETAMSESRVAVPKHIMHEIMLTNYQRTASVANIRRADLQNSEKIDDDNRVIKARHNVIKSEETAMSESRVAVQKHIMHEIMLTNYQRTASVANIRRADLQSSEKIDHGNRVIKARHNVIKSGDDIIY